MIDLYKHFKRVGIVFCAGFLLLCPPAHAQNLTVEGVVVDVTAKNAVEARTKALDEAQVKAYRKLLEQNLGAEKAATIKDPDPITVGTWVKDFEVTNEQISAVRYKGTYTVRFRANALKNYMADTNVTTVSIDDSGMALKPDSAYPREPAVTATVNKILILPYFQTGDRAVIWEGNNPFRTAWSRVPTLHEERLVLPLGDLTDMNTLMDNQALTFTADAMNKILARYNTTQAAIIMATQNPMKGLDVHIYMSEQGGKPRFIRTLQVMPESAGQPLVMLFDRAVQDAKPVLSSIAKAAPIRVPAPQPIAATPAPTGPTQNYQGTLYFASAQEWVKLKNTLDRIPGMRGIIVRGMTPKMATLDMNFAGDPELLSVALSGAGVVMKQSTTDEKIEMHGSHGR